LLPFGAPGDIPPCIRQRPFGMLGDRHSFPLLVRAPHRSLRCIGNLFCLGLILCFQSAPSPGGLDSADHRLPASVDMNVLHSDLLLGLAAVPVERIEQDRIAAREFLDRRPHRPMLDPTRPALRVQPVCGLKPGGRPGTSGTLQRRQPKGGGLRKPCAMKLSHTSHTSRTSHTSPSGLREREGGPAVAKTVGPRWQRGSVFFI
jgi:hypothetical protein